MKKLLGAIGPLLIVAICAAVPLMQHPKATPAKPKKVWTAGTQQTFTIRVPADRVHGHPGEAHTLTLVFSGGGNLTEAWLEEGSQYETAETK